MQEHESPPTSSCETWTWQLSGGGRSDTWHGAQLAIDTTLVSPLRRYGTATTRAANHDARNSLVTVVGHGWSCWLQMESRDSGVLMRTGQGQGTIRATVASGSSAGRFDVPSVQEVMRDDQFA